jgi:hypothetical protein
MSPRACRQPDQQLAICLVLGGAAVPEQARTRDPRRDLVVISRHYALEPFLDIEQAQRAGHSQRERREGLPLIDGDDVSTLPWPAIISSVSALFGVRWVAF